jgi:hypothetical protein
MSDTLPADDAAVDPPDGWLTVAQAAKQTGLSERAIRRAVKLEKNAARTQAGRRQTHTGTRQATFLAPDLVSELAEEHRQNAAALAAQDGANTGATVADDTETPANAADVLAPGTVNTGTTPALDGDTRTNTGNPAQAEHGKTLAQVGTTVADSGAIPAEHGATVPERGGYFIPQRDESTLELLDQLRSENAFLRAQVEADRLQIEAANRSAAESAAALREYIRKQPKQLTAGGEDGPRTAPGAPPLADRAHEAGRAGERPQGRPQAKRRGLWSWFMGND